MRLWFVAAFSLSLAADQTPWSRPEGTPECASESLRNGAWCRKCNVGHIGGVRVPSAALFETLDAHGHRVDPSRLRCETCTEAFHGGGFCSQCGMGFVGKQAYLSKLAYCAATGNLEDARHEIARLEAAVDLLERCERCAIALFTGGRCRVCRLSYSSGEPEPILRRRELGR